MAYIHKNKNEHDKEYTNENTVIIHKKRLSSSSTVAITSRSDGIPRKKKRGTGGVRGHNEDPYPSTHPALTTCLCKQIFDGMLVAVSNFNSTSETEEEARGGSTSIAHDVPDVGNQEHYSYKGIAQRLRTGGAKVSSQVHKRIHALIASNVTSYNHREYTLTARSTPILTQRIRKALKFNIPIVDVSWVEDSMNKGQRLDMQPYLFNRNAVTIDTQMATKRAQAHAKEPRTSNQDSPENDQSGGSTTTNKNTNSSISLGCCCACHDCENAVYDCPWCISCR